MVKFEPEMLQETRMLENLPLIQAASSSTALHDALSTSRDHTRRSSVERNPGRQAASTPFPVSQRLLLLMEHSLDFVELLGAEGIIEGVSAAIKPLGGYDPQDLIGSKYQDLIHPDDRARAANAFSRVLRGDAAETVTVRYHRKDGAWRTVQASTRNFLKDPAVRAVVVLTRDVTDQFNDSVQCRFGETLEAVDRGEERGKNLPRRGTTRQCAEYPCWLANAHGTFEANPDRLFAHGLGQYLDWAGAGGHRPPPRIDDRIAGSDHR